VGEGTGIDIALYYATNMYRFLLYTRLNFAGVASWFKVSRFIER